MIIRGLNPQSLNPQSSILNPQSSILSFLFSGLHSSINALLSVTTYFKFWTKINRKMSLSGGYFIKYLVFGHDFWIEAIFSFSWVINICHVLQIGTNNDQICGNILPFQSGHSTVLDIMARINMAWYMGIIGVNRKNKKNLDHQ